MIKAHLVQVRAEHLVMEPVALELLEQVLPDQVAHQLRIIAVTGQLERLEQPELLEQAHHLNLGQTIQ